MQNIHSEIINLEKISVTLNGVHDGDKITMPPLLPRPIRILPKEIRKRLENYNYKKN